MAFSREQFDETLVAISGLPDQFLFGRSCSRKLLLIKPKFIAFRLCIFTLYFPHTFSLYTKNEKNAVSELHARNALSEKSKLFFLLSLFPYI